MDRKKHILVGLGTVGKAPFTPVQVQKLFFLLDRNGKGPHFGQPKFNFKPYDFGPFDAEVYRELERLSEQELVEISFDNSGLKHFRLTAEGQQEAEKCLKQLDSRSLEFVEKISSWIRKQTFAGLLSAIYNAYPDMAVKSVFRQR